MMRFLPCRNSGILLRIIIVQILLKVVSSEDDQSCESSKGAASSVHSLGSNSIIDTSNGNNQKQQRPSRILFGSCNSQHNPQPLWPIMMNRNAAAFIWGGDSVYADDRPIYDDYGKRTAILDATPEYITQLFQQQRNHPGYKAFLDTGIHIFGALDDHDYGTNNGDSTFIHKRGNGLAFVGTFLNINPQDSMYQRASQGKGVYGVQVYDFDRPAGQQVLSQDEAGIEDHRQSNDNNTSTINTSQRTVAVFALDVRSNKTPWKKNMPDRWQDNLEGDFLGEEQWEWLERSLRRSNAAVNIIVTGFQVHANRIYDGNLVEDWSKYPNAQNRLYQALLQPNVQAPVLVSGDVHFAQYLRKDCFRTVPRDDDKNSREHTILQQRSLMEITTSGLTHAWGASQMFGRTNLSRLAHIRGLNTFSKCMATFAHWVNPWTDIVVDEQTGKLQYTTELNFAELDIDWEERVLHSRIWGEDPGADPLLVESWSLDALSNELLPSKFQHTHAARTKPKNAETTKNVDGGEWKCRNYRGTPNPIHRFLGLALTLATALVLPVLLPMALCMGIIIRFLRWLKNKLFSSSGSSITTDN